MIAKNQNEFIEKVVEAERIALNSEAGQDIIKELLKIVLKKNPGLTVDEWKKIKQEFMVFIFANLLNKNKNLMSEFAEHTYNDLIKEG